MRPPLSGLTSASARLRVLRRVTAPFGSYVPRPPLSGLTSVTAPVGSYVMPPHAGSPRPPDFVHCCRTALVAQAQEQGAAHSSVQDVGGSCCVAPASRHASMSVAANIHAPTRPLHALAVAHRLRRALPCAVAARRRLHLGGRLHCTPVPAMPWVPMLPQSGAICAGTCNAAPIHLRRSLIRTHHRRARAIRSWKAEGISPPPARTQR